MPSGIHQISAMIQDHGASFAAGGTELSTGPKLFCLSGHVARPGVYEVPFGRTLREMIDLAKMVADLKAKYIGTTLAIASNRQPITDAELEQLKNFRVKIQELEAAHNELNEAIASQLVEVRGVVKE